MLRRKPMKQGKPMGRSKGPIDKRARARRAMGGAQAVGRDSLSVEAYRSEKAAIWARAKGKCEVCKMRKPVDPDHVKARSAGGTDDQANLLALCRACHDLRTAPYLTGRLQYDVVDNGVYWNVIRARDKWAFQSGRYEVLRSGFVLTKADD